MESPSCRAALIVHPVGRYRNLGKAKDCEVSEIMRGRRGRRTPNAPGRSRRESMAPPLAKMGTVPGPCPKHLPGAGAGTALSGQRGSPSRRALKPQQELVRKWYGDNKDMLNMQVGELFAAVQVNGFVDFAQFLQRPSTRAYFEMADPALSNLSA